MAQSRGRLHDDNCRGPQSTASFLEAHLLVGRVAAVEEVHPRKARVVKEDPIFAVVATFALVVIAAMAIYKMMEGLRP